MGWRCAPPRRAVRTTPAVLHTRGTLSAHQAGASWGGALVVVLTTTGRSVHPSASSRV